jgi:putative PIN family toxin of toxin-antitoxin system
LRYLFPGACLGDIAIRHRFEVGAGIVLDTAVLVAALRSDRGASRVLLTSALEGTLTVLASVPLMAEYEAVATGPEHLDAAGLTEADVRTVLDAFASVAGPVRLAFLWRPLLTDVADDMVLETAVNGRAELVVTMNRRDFEPAIGLFDLNVVSPGEALTRLRRKS